jgi:hypothetical protein
MRLFLVTAIVLMSLPCCGEVIEIDKSSSPNNLLYLTIEPLDSEGMAMGTAEVRLRKTGKVVGSFGWEGFGVRPDASAFAVVWKPDSRAFAIAWESSRGYVSYAVYALDEGKWKEAKQPDFLTKIYKQKHFSSGYGKGHESPLRWEDASFLVLNVGGMAYKQTPTPYSGTGLYDYLVYLRLHDYGSGPLLSIVKMENQM